MIRLILEYDEKHYEGIINFLKRVPSLEEIDTDVIINSVLCIDENDSIRGIISYEAFSDDVLIRYFIYHKKMADSEINELLEKIIQKVKELGFKRIISIVQLENMKNFFKKYDFSEHSAEMLFLDEERLLCRDDTKAMIKVIEKSE